MDHIPLEIWAEICALACVDNGRTGRALSLVSRLIHEASKPYKLQSITVIGERQLSEFADLIEQTPTHLRRVKCIFIIEQTRIDIGNWNDEVLSQKRWRLHCAYVALERILCAISSSVRIVHTYFVHARPFVLLPISLPVLEELVAHGPISSVVKDNNNSIQFKALKHLTFTWACNPAFLLAKVLVMTPSLLNFCTSAHDLALDISAFQFPTYLQRIFIHPPIEPKRRTGESILIYDINMVVYNEFMVTLRVLNDKDKRVTLLPPLQLNGLKLVSTLEAEANWNISAAGGSQHYIRPTSPG